MIYRAHLKFTGHRIEHKDGIISFFTHEHKIQNYRNNLFSIKHIPTSLTKEYLHKCIRGLASSLGGTM
jgi:hypothetical protein